MNPPSEQGGRVEAGDLQEGQSYIDAEGNVRRIDRIAGNLVQYTVLACETWPKHVGKNYVCCPRWFAGLAINTLEAEKNTR